MHPHPNPPARHLPTHSRRPRSRRVVAAVSAVCLALLGVLATPSGPASAGPVSDAAGFEFDDGNLAPQAPINFDWNSFSPTTWTGTAPFRTSSKTTSGWAFTGLEDAQATNSDTAFAGGTKQDDDCASVGTGKAPNKDDLKRVYVTSKTVGGDVFLGLSWVRIPQNTTSSSAHIGFEFNQGDTACPAGSDGLVERTAGDMLIVYDFEGGAGTPTITLRRWVTSGACEVGASSPPCWGPATDLTAAGFAEAKVNTGVSVSDTVGTSSPASETLNDSEFGEAGINLTDAGVFSPNVCTAFGNAYAVSRSSGNSATAAMKDLVGPGDINIANCGNVIIHKVTDPSPDPADTTFDYTTSGGLDPATFSLKDGQTQDYGGDVFAGSYSVTETDPGPTFELTGLDCSASETSDGTTFTTDLATGTVDFDLAANDTVECTYTNTLQVGALQILKNSTKGGPVSQAGAVFSYDGASVTDNGAADEDPTVGKVCVSGLVPGDYDVTETSAPPGYGDPVNPGPLTATVVVGTNCTDNPPTGSAVVTFTDPPLSDIQVNFRDGGSGETSATITCDNTTGTGDDTPASGWDTTRTVTGIEAPTTVRCTIEIDP
jgi:Prealbumin-like fold domain